MLTIRMFGKEGCKKCDLLQGRLTKLLKDTRFVGEFELVKSDILNKEDLIDFCELESLAGNKIPAFVVYREGEVFPITHQKLDSHYSSARWLGLITNYDFGGILKPELIEQVLETALTKK